MKDALHAFLKLILVETNVFVVFNKTCKHVIM